MRVRSMPRGRSPPPPGAVTTPARTSVLAAEAVSDLGPPFQELDHAGPPVVALGKFDALHVGHRALAAKAAALGSPYLVSFSGMAEVFGKAPTVPLTAPPDRRRVLRNWATEWAKAGKGEYTLEERVFPFAAVRPLSPEDFVLLLADQGVCGIIAGSNYRFGYKAAGDAALLQELGSKHGLVVEIVDIVMSSDVMHGQMKRVSSTRIRECLAMGDVDEAAALLGRRHRAVFAPTTPRPVGGVKDNSECVVPRQWLLNRLPADGTYVASLTLAHEASGLAVAHACAEVEVGSAGVRVPGGSELTLLLASLELGAPFQLFVDF